MSPSSTGAPDDDSGPDYRQLSLVALAALALVLAAFFAPVAGDGISGPSADPGSPEFDADPDGEPEGNVDADGDGDLDPDSLPDLDWERLLELFDWLEPDDGDGDLEVDDGDPPPAACTVVLDDDPVPGSEVTATIRYGGEPLAGIPVAFNDRPVGETDEYGQVTGEVPYVEELVVTIETDDHPECAASGETTDAGFSSVSVSVSENDGSSGTVPDVTPAVAAGVATGIDDPRGDELEDGTVEYDVDGDVELALHGQPDPGETVTLEASIEGVPMGDATVTVDGDEIGETDRDGTAVLEIPDDGTDAFELGVARGDFEGTTTVDVRLLEASLSPQGIAPVPGSPGVLEATIGDEPVDDAAVSIDGESLGTTDGDGRLDITLPADPRTAVTVGTDDRTASVSLVDAYGDVTLVLTLAVAVLTAAAGRTHGARGALAVVGTVAALLIVLVVEAFYGSLPALVALLAVGAALLAVRLYRGDRSLTLGRPSIGGGRSWSLSGLRAWLVARTLAVVALLERGVDRLRAWLAVARGWLGSLPRSATGLYERANAWLATVPGRLRTYGDRGLERLRSIRPAAIDAAVVAGAAVAAGYVVDDRRGAAVVAVALAVVGLYYWQRTQEDSTPTDADDLSDEGPTVDPTAAASDDGSEPKQSFRELWRAFARRVAPRRWPTSTPGEIQRTALEQGYPRRPVAELTGLFREVEYGGRPLSSGLRERADRAYGELLESDGDGGDRDGESDRDHDRGTETESESENGPASDSSPTSGSETDVMETERQTQTQTRTQTQTGTTDDETRRDGDQP